MHISTVYKGLKFMWTGPMSPLSAISSHFRSPRSPVLIFLPKVEERGTTTRLKRTISFSEKFWTFGLAIFLAVILSLTAEKYIHLRERKLKVHSILSDTCTGRMGAFFYSNFSLLAAKEARQISIHWCFCAHAMGYTAVSHASQITNHDESRRNQKNRKLLSYSFISVMKHA